MGELPLHKPGIGAISRRTEELTFKQSCRSRSELPTSGLSKEHGQEGLRLDRVDAECLDKRSQDRPAANHYESRPPSRRVITANVADAKASKTIRPPRRLCV